MKRVKAFLRAVIAAVVFVSVIAAAGTFAGSGRGLISLDRSAVRDVSADDGSLGDPIDPAGNLSGFAYNQLSEEVQSIYAQLYSGIAERRSEFTISARDSDDISPALAAILTDCPEFFWIDGTASMTGFRGLGIWRITLGFNIDSDEIDAVQAQIDAKTQEYIDSLPEGAGDYEKVKTAYEYLIRTTDYRIGSEQNQNIQSVFLYGESVCAGYARAFKYLCDRVGVECAYIEGKISGESEDEGHAWDLVRIDDVYTYVDPSWGDPTYGEDNTDAKRLDIIYDYLCLTEAEMLRARHVPDESLVLPATDSRYYDYYILNGYYHEGYDRDRVSRALWHAVDEAESVVYMKFSDEEAYNEALYALFPEGEERESLIDAPMRQRMEWDEISSIRYYYSCSKELYIIKIYW